MSTGKSLSYSFETSIHHLDPPLRPFYHRIHYKIFYLKDHKANFFFNFQNDLFDNLYKVAHSSSNQTLKLKKLRIQTVEIMETQRKEKSLKSSYVIQSCFIGFFFVATFIWHLMFRERSPRLEALSLLLFLTGFFVSNQLQKNKEMI